VKLCLALLLALCSASTVAEELSALFDRAYRLQRMNPAPPRELERTAAELRGVLMRIGDAADPEAEVVALDLLAGIGEAQGQPADALAATRRALHLSQQMDVPAYAYRLHWRLARLLEPAGESAALDHWRAAVGEMERAGRGEVPAEARRSLYSALVDRLLRGAEREHGAAAQVLLREAVSVWESSKVDELRDYLGESCLIPRAELDAGAAEQPGVALLYPMLLPDRLELVLGVGGVLHRFTNDRDRRRLESVARRFAATVGAHRKDFARYGRLLHRVLLQPVLPILHRHRVHTLVLVPDGILRSVPLAALQDEGGRYLIQDFALAATPGLGLVRPASDRAAPRTALLAGLSVGARHQGIGFAPLPGAAAELYLLGDRLKGPRLRDDAFTADALRELLGREDFDLIHLATHAEIAPRRADSFLLTHDGGLPMDELERQIARRRFAGRPLELITLSACRTAVGDADSALGLGGLAVQSGARSALASLWRVDDAASSRLMSGFYRRWLDQPERGKARALQAAQQELIEAGFGHPFFWAGFQLIGGWD